MKVLSRNFLLAITAAAVGGIGFLAAVPDPAAAQDLDMNEIFRCHPTEKVPVERCDEARQLVLSNCTLCHIFVPIVMQQFDEAGWDSLIVRHREANRVDTLSDEQVETIRDYLAANFNPNYDPPELPPELLENWTSY
jgi:hypothetical protein